jgi:hypothetical protein
VYCAKRPARLPQHPPCVKAGRFIRPCNKS